jgi:hypothetical protein
VGWGSDQCAAKWRRRGAWPRCARAGGPGHERRVVRQRQLGDNGARSRTGEAGEEREEREQMGWPVGRPAEWGPAIRGMVREWQVGPAAIQIKFKIIQICSNLVRINTSLLKLQNFKIKYGVG